MDCSALGGASHGWGPAKVRLSARTAERAAAGQFAKGEVRWIAAHWGGHLTAGDQRSYGYRRVRLRAQQSRRKDITMRHVVLLTLMAWSAVQAQQYTLGVGVYPGDPRENFAPVTQLDQTYRNLALHRPAYQSSSYDYNLTAQLITDGIKDTKLPRWVAVSTSQQGELKKNEREWLLDHNWLTGVSLKGTGGWVQVELAGGDGARQVDRVDIDARVQSGQSGQAERSEERRVTKE